jgi:hypothetical protein
VKVATVWVPEGAPSTTVKVKPPVGVTAGSETTAELCTVVVGADSCARVIVMS